MAGILLDALWPPAPLQLVQDCRAVGAAGCWVYAARFGQDGADLGIGGWSADHVAELHLAGLVAPAIIVPGGRPGDVQPMLAAAAALGCDRIAAFDLEAFSLASPQWVGSAVGVARSLGWRVLRYGDLPVLAGYPAADGDWLSHGRIPVEAGSWQPVPALPAGLVADQYAVEVVIGTSSYDVSVADLAAAPAAGGGAMADGFTDGDRTALGDAVGVMAKLDSRFLGDIGPTADVGLGQLVAQVTNLTGSVGQLQAQLGQLAARPPAGAPAPATGTIDVQALAAAVADELERRLATAPPPAPGPQAGSGG